MSTHTVNVTARVRDLRARDTLIDLHRVRVARDPDRTTDIDGRIRLVVVNHPQHPGRAVVVRLTADAPVHVQRIARVGDLVRYETRTGGTLVQVIDCDHPDSPASPAEPMHGTGDRQRWGTLCVPHGGFIHHSTLALAISNASDSATWCPSCGGDQ